MDQGPNWPNTTRFSGLRSKLAKHGPFWWFRVQIGQKRSVLVDKDPNWPKTVRFGGSGSKLAKSGPCWWVRVQIGQKQSVLVDKDPSFMRIGPGIWEELRDNENASKTIITHTHLCYINYLSYSQIITVTRNFNLGTVDLLSPWITLMTTQLSHLWLGKCYSNDSGLLNYCIFWQFKTFPT